MGRGTARTKETSRPEVGGRRKQGWRGNKDCGEVNVKEGILDFSPSTVFPFYITPCNTSR